MNNFAFCTLTYGEKYIKFGDSLINQLNNNGHHVFVLTSDFNHYTSTDILTPMRHDSDYFSFHEKRNIVKECLKRYDTAIFLDSDVFIKDTSGLNVFNDMDPGLHIFSNFGDISQNFLNNDHGKFTPTSVRNGKYGELGFNFLKNNNFKYKQPCHGDSTECYLPHFLEGRWAIRRENGKENVFFDKWDLLANFTDKVDIEFGFINQIGAGEGSHMSIAARNSEMSLHNLSPYTSFIEKNFISNYQEKVDGTKPWNAAG